MKGYSFLTGGHWFGAHTPLNAAPASTLVSAQNKINEMHPDFLISLGDMVFNANDCTEVKNFRSFVSGFNSPVYMVPGNHDLDPKGNYHIGNFIPFFQYQSDQFLFLNSELPGAGKANEVLNSIRMLQEQSPGKGNLFVFSHRLFWAIGETELAEMDAFSNQPLPENFNRDSVKMIFDAVLSLCGKRKLYWFSGDIGVNGSLPAFYQSLRNGERNYFAAGLGETKEDAMWEIQVDSTGNVTPKLFLLTKPDSVFQGELPGINFWRKEMAIRKINPSDGRNFSFLLKRYAPWILGFLLVLAGWIFLRRKNSAQK